jgi:hypothetical protein
VPECVICEKPCDGECKNFDGEPVHVECLSMASGYADQKLYRCPYCGQDTPHPRGAFWYKLLSSRMTCQECRGEFLIVDDVPTAD